MAIDVKFNEQDWERIARDWTAWWAGTLERPMVMIVSLDPPPGVELPDSHHFTSNFPLTLPADQVLDHLQRRIEAQRFYGDAFPKWFPNFGPGIGAGFLGSKVMCAEDTVWFEPANQVDIRDLRIAYDANNIWWQRVLELTRAAVNRWGRQVLVGYTDIGGTLDILASLRTTQQLLFDLYDTPDQVARLAREITALWLRYYDELHAIIKTVDRGTTPWAPIWSPQRCYMLQCDFAFMISPKMFERFVLPDLKECCAHLDHAFYHLDGKGQIPHLDLLLSIERLRGIQWIPGEGAPPVEDWLPLLKRIRDAGKLCQIYVTAEGARKIVREIGGRGFAFYITQRKSKVHISQHFTPEEATDIYRTLIDESGRT